MILIKYKERRFIDKYTCIDTVKIITVQNFAFASGNLLYYKKDRFNYLVISKSDLISEFDLNSEDKEFLKHGLPF